MCRIGGVNVWLSFFFGGNTFDSSWFSLVWWFLLSGRHYSFLMDQDALRQQGEVYIRKTKLTGFPKRSIHLPDRVHLSIYGLHINLAFSEIIYPFCSLLCEHQYVGSTNWTAGSTCAIGASSDAQRQDEWLQQLWPFPIHGQATLQAHTKLIDHVYPGCSNGVADENLTA